MVGTCDYSVHPKAIGHKVDIRADLSHVEVRWAGELVASHRRCWGRHLVITDPAHEAAGATMRAEHRHLARWRFGSPSPMSFDATCAAAVLW